MRIRIIIEGSKKIERLRKYWGLSMLIGGDVLFDTFADAKALKARFKKYKIDVKNIKHVLISHDHWDHTGGLWWALESNKDAIVYVCSGVSDGLKNKIRQSGNKLVEVKQPAMIKENIYTTGEIMGTYNGRPLAELSIVLTQGDKLALLTGCSHPGILNILSRVSRLHRQKIDLVLGGLHLAGAAVDELEKIAVKCGDTYHVKSLAPFHCTGARAVRFLGKRMPAQLIKARAGDVFDFVPERSSWERMKRGVPCSK